MSRPSVAPSQRNFTLTEELEKLEQSITLTLQEIDHNFSRAHRIVTTSILPVVEQYAQHSSAVWEGSKFWKQFFEASANVSLSSYEEPPEGADQEPTNTDIGAEDYQDPSTQLTPSSSSYASPSQDEGQTTTPEPRTYRPSSRQQEEESTLLTPRAKPPAQPSFSSPYESLKRTVNPSHTDEPSTSTLPSTPRAQRGSPTPDSSPFAPRPPASTARAPANDVLLHRVLDKNWRLQATPHAQPKLPNRAFSSVRKGGGVPTETPRPGTEADELDDSSPFVPAPELHAEIFESPLRRTRVPGVSLLTPAKGRGGTNPDAGREAAIGGGRGKERDIWDSDSDDEGGLEEGMSPPKTMQFHIPRERLLRTPAREASKRIVEDLLQSAGGNVTDDLDEDSPSVVRRTQAMDEDTF